jgi:hypothetical protein
MPSLQQVGRIAATPPQLVAASDLPFAILHRARHLLSLPAMTRLRRIPPTGFWNWLLLAPFLLTTLLAPGVMPHRADDGSLTVVLCSDGGPVEVRIDLATGQPLPADQHPDDKRCDWHMARDGAALAAAPLALTLAVVVTAIETPSSPLGLTLQTRQSRPFARGPPILI